MIKPIPGLLLLILPLAFSTFNARAQQKLKVVSYNIHHGANTQDVDKLAEMGSYLKSLNADVIALEEVDSLCKRTGGIDQAAYLAKAAGMHYSFTQHFPYQGGSYGLALLTRKNVTNLSNTKLPARPEANTSFLRADIKLENGKTVTLGVVHFESQSDKARQAQAEIVNTITEKSATPVILMGDLNAEPHETPITLLRKNYKLTQAAGAYTFPIIPNKKIDYILTDKRLKTKVTATLVDKVYYSDHLPIISEIEIK